MKPGSFGAVNLSLKGGCRCRGERCGSVLSVQCDGRRQDERMLQYMFESCPRTHRSTADAGQEAIPLSLLTYK